MNRILFFSAAFLLCLYLFGQKKRAQYVPRDHVFEYNTRPSFSGALEYYRTIRNNQITGDISFEDYRRAIEEADLLEKSGRSSTLTWKNIGPVDQGGRIRSIIIDKNNHNVLYAGAVSGGIWKSTNSGQSWFVIDDLLSNLIVSCMDQAPNGTIWFGTGEDFAPVLGSTNGGTGFLGNGLYRSTDASGNAFVHVSSTNPDLDDAWEYVYKIKNHPNGDIYAATRRGIKKSSDNGQTWTNPLSSFSGTTSKAYDVDISPDGSVISLVVFNKVYISTDGGQTYTNVSTGGATGLPASGLSRIEIGISPSNPNYIYAVAAKASNHQLHNVYRSTNKGQTWEIIGPGGSQYFNPLGTQGYFDNVCEVHPTNPKKVYVGGLDLWVWEEGKNWEQKSLWYLSEFSSYFLHADHHCYVFHPQNPNVMYFGTDGGVSVSFDGGETFQTRNRNLVNTQFYSIEIGAEGQIIGGTQDNGTLFMSRKGFIEGQSEPYLGGDGGYCAISHLNPKIIIGSIYYGDVQRTPTGLPDGFDKFYDSFVTSLPGYNSTSFAAFVTPLILHEKIDDYFSPDSVRFTADQNYQIGDTIIVRSSTSSYPFPHVLTTPLNAGDTIYVQDIVTTKFYVGINNAVIMTREVHNFARTPKWYLIANISGMVQSMAISNCGNFLFVGTTQGRVYRLSNLWFANDSLSASAGTTTNPNPYHVIEVKQIANFSGRSVNGIAIDPNNPARVVVVLGNYGNQYYVYFSQNALSETPTFIQKQGNLPKMPVYSALIELTNENTVILGTELGVFMTTNITATSPTWTDENINGMARVPVYSLKQQTRWLPGVTNYGIIYAGTHGRGIYECQNFVKLPEYANSSSNYKNLKIYPNPSSDFITLETSLTGYLTINIFNIDGKLVQTSSFNTEAGKNPTIQISHLNEGIYIIQVIVNKNAFWGKFTKIN